MLVGRGREQAVLAELVEHARHGTAGCVVVRGEPGVGKTALLEDLVAGVGEALVVRTQGLEVEAPLAFAALHRLLRPLMRLRQHLPDPQARALRVAFAEEDGPSVEPFLVAIATLSLLTAAAEEGLVVCVVEDAHWLDPATADALLFCARRIAADRVLMVFSARDGAERTFRPEGLAELVLTGLDPEAARALLDERLGAPSPSEAVTDRLVAETGGNPLALLELPTELSETQLRGSSALPGHLPLTDRVEHVFLDRCRRLPDQVQLLVLVAAAEDAGDLAAVRQAAAALGVDEDALEAATASGLLVTDALTVRVRHPLVRSAVYQAATDAQRRGVHRVLAEVLAGHGDPDREAWHRAAATDGPDQEVVVALEGVGARAERRGGYAAAWAAYERAASLTTSAEQRVALTFAAARNAWACGQAARSRELLTLAQATASDPWLLADISRLRGRIEVNVGSATDAHRIFTEAATAVSAVDPRRALEMAVAAALLLSYGADSGAVLGDRDALIASADDDTPRAVCLKQMLLAMTRAAESDTSGAVEALDVAVRAGETVVDLDVLGNLGNAALQLGDDAAQQHYYTLGLSRARETGAVMGVIYALQRLCFGYLVAGDWAAVRSCADEALALGQGIGSALTAPPLAWLTLLAALQGRDDYESLLHDLESVTADHPLGILTDPVHDLTRWAKGARAAASSDTFDALHQLSHLRLPAIRRMAATEAIDAAVRAEEPDLARRWVDEIVGFADATGRPWARATVAYGRAMTADPPETEGWFTEALTHHASAGRPVDEARTHLAYGEWLRRAQRRVDARLHLRHALGSFEDLRAHPLAGRATQELRASGETARKRDPSTLVKLTPMELKVAQLVASGLSNKDVAAQCWVSPRTVAFHLRNVFAKAGITSRGELAQLSLD